MLGHKLQLCIYIKYDQSNKNSVDEKSVSLYQKSLQSMKKKEGKKTDTPFEFLYHLLSLATKMFE